MNKILVVNINWLGDAIFSTPVFAALRTAYPRSHIACLCVPRVREVLRYCPHIDEIIIYDEKGKDRWPWKKLALITRLRKGGFDAAFLLHRSMTRALLCFLAGIPRRIGYGKFQGLLTHPVAMNDEGLHRSDYYLEVLKNYGIAVPHADCQLRLSDADVSGMDLKLKKQNITPESKVIVLNTGGNWDLKRWPISRWIELARKIADEKKWVIVFSGSHKDADDAKRIIEAAAIKAINFCGQTSLGESLALFSRAAVVVSADSGPLHLANSVHSNVVGLYGPTRIEATGPRGTGGQVVLFEQIGCNHAPCYHLSCSENLCMKAIGVDDVFQAIEKFTG